MARTSVKKNMVKQVNYLNKDFSDFRDNLIEFAKVYFPNTYNDFNESSPGMMFIEMAAYVGDVLSYYIDSSFRESLLAYAEEKRNIYTIAQSFGYKPKVTSPASAVLDVFQSVPALNEKPDIGVIANETSLHIPIAIKLAKEGLDLFLEKPLSDSLEGVSELLSIVKKKKLITQMGCNLRFHPCIKKIKDLVVHI